MCMTLVSCWMLAACSNEPFAKDQSGKYVISGKCTPGHLAEAIANHEDATLILDFGPNTSNLAQIANAAKRATPPFAVAVDHAPKDGQEIADAVIVVDTGAAAAVDFALLASGGVALQPNRIEIGTRTITKANRAAGGSPLLAPGDVLLAMLRMEHKELLTTTPATDVRHSIGLIACQPDAPWQAATTAAVTKATDRYPQLQLVNGFVAGKANTPTEQAARLVG